jgi:hypothetical protein
MAEKEQHVPSEQPEIEKVEEGRKNGGGLSPERLQELAALLVAQLQKDKIVESGGSIH